LSFLPKGLFLSAALALRAAAAMRRPFLAPVTTLPSTFILPASVRVALMPVRAALVAKLSAWPPTSAALASRETT